MLVPALAQEEPALVARGPWLVARGSWLDALYDLLATGFAPTVSRGAPELPKLAEFGLNCSTGASIAPTRVLVQ